MSMRVWISAFLLLCVVHISWATSRFLALTDIHFDPYIACYQAKKPCPLITNLQNAPVEQWSSILAQQDKTEAHYRLDTNYTLLTNVLYMAGQEAQQQHVDFVLVLGDFLGHEYRHYYKKYTLDKSRANYQAFVKKSLAFLTLELQKTFPQSDVYMLAGNNDSYHGDYYVDSHGAFFQDTAVSWSRLIQHATNASLMRQGFANAGYYAVDITPDLRLIMLNTVLFSNKARGNHVSQAASQELNWFAEQLQSAKDKNQRVFIGMHIPKAMDMYLASKFYLFTLKTLWMPSYAERYDTLVQQFAPQIAGVFAGHLHFESTQIQQGEGAEFPLMIVPSISPIFGNRPGFNVYTYDEATGQIIDSETVDFSLFVH